MFRRRGFLNWHSLRRGLWAILRNLGREATGAQSCQY
jgi:hypothetical protein